MTNVLARAVRSQHYTPLLGLAIPLSLDLVRNKSRCRKYCISNQGP